MNISQAHQTHAVQGYTRDQLYELYEELITTLQNTRDEYSPKSREIATKMARLMIEDTNLIHGEIMPGHSYNLTVEGDTVFLEWQMSTVREVMHDIYPTNIIL